MAKSKERTIKLSTIYQELIEKQVEEENPIENVTPSISIDRLPLSAYQEIVDGMSPVGVELINLYEIIYFVFHSLKNIPIKKIIYLDNKFQLTTKEQATRLAFVFGDEPTPDVFKPENTVLINTPIHDLLVNIQEYDTNISSANIKNRLERALLTRRLFKAFSPTLIAAYWTVITEHTDFMSTLDRVHLTVNPKDILSHILKIDYSKRDSFKDKRLATLQDKLSSMFIKLSQELPFKLIIGQNDICNVQEHGHSQILITVYDADYRMACLEQFNVKFTN